MVNGNNRFDKSAKDWDTPNKIKRANAIAEAIIDLLPPEKLDKALEIGCGTGLMSFALKDHFNDITLVDTSAGMIEVLRQKIADVGVKCFTPLLSDIFATPINEHFDAIYTAMTLHHIHDTNKAFKTFKELLTPGGRLFIADLDKEDGSFHLVDKDVHLGFEREALAEVARSAGFTNISFRTAYTMTKTRNIFFKKKYPIFLLSAIKE